jgi:hypothetical protein
MLKGENMIQYEKTFEDEIYDIMEKFILNNRLSMNDIKACREICTQFENRILANELTDKLKFYCKLDNYDINFENEKEQISVLSVEHIGVNKDEKNMNKKDHIIIMTINFYNNASKLIYEIIEEYSDNGKQKFLFYKFTIDGNLILKKEQQTLKPTFINLSYLKDFIENNKIKLNITQYLKLFTKLFGIYNFFEKEICQIENDSHNYCKDKSWESDSDISITDDDKN